MKKKTAREKKLWSMRYHSAADAAQNTAAQNTPPSPPPPPGSPPPYEFPPGAPPETPPGTPVEVPQPDVPPLPGAPPPQADALFIRYLRRSRHWIIRRHKIVAQPDDERCL